MASLATPLELLRSLAESIRALTELPVTLERNLRDTNTLIGEARTQLAVLGTHVSRMMEQLDKMATVTDRLVEGTKSIAAAAQDTQQQMVLTSAQLAAANRSLEQIVRLAEPLDRMGKRVAEGLQRVTGRRGTPAAESD